MCPLLCTKAEGASWPLPTLPRSDDARKPLFGPRQTSPPDETETISCATVALDSRAQPPHRPLYRWGDRFRQARAILLPITRQLFIYEARDLDQQLSGVVLEVEGDLCGHVQKLLKECGRCEDYVEASLIGNLRYNPLNNDADPYAQTFNIASIIIAIWGKSKEPFWG